MTSKTKRQLKTWVLFLVAAFVVEIITSWWTFMRAPTDGLRPLFKMSFVSYEADRIATRLSLFLLASLFAFLISRKQIIQQ